MNTFSGKWAFDVGLPAKSSTMGMTILVIPNLMGIAVWCPKLNKEGNSIKGQEFLRSLIDTFGFNDIDHVYGAGLMKKMLLNLSSKAGKKNSINLLYYAKQNKLKEIRQAVAQGACVQYRNYDSRTALHIACNYGHFEIVKYLVSHGASVLVKDRFGNNPLDEAKNAGFDKIVEYLGNFIN